MFYYPQTINERTKLSEARKPEVLAWYVKWKACLNYSKRQVIIMDLPDRKAATGSSSVKEVFWGVFLRRSLRCFEQCNLSCEKKSSSVANGGTLAKLGALLKIFLCLEYWDVLDFNQEYKLRASWGVPLWYLLAFWENDGVLFYL